MGITPARPNRRKRTKNPPINQPELNTPIIISDVDASASVLTLTFDQSVALKGTPQITTNIAGAEPVSAQKTAPNIVAITYSEAIASAVTLTIPHRDPAIRSASGGFVISTTFPLAA